MKRRLGRLFARVKGVVKRVWQRFFPPPSDPGAAIEPPETPKQVRAHDGVEDADYEEVRSNGIPPVARAETPPERKPAAPRPRERIPNRAAAPPRDDHIEDTVVADLIAKVDRFLATGEPPLASDDDVTVVTAPPARRTYEPPRIVDHAFGAETDASAPAEEPETPAAAASPRIEDEPTAAVVDTAADQSHESTVVETAADEPVESPVETFAEDAGQSQVDAAADELSVNHFASEHVVVETTSEGRDEAPVVTRARVVELASASDALASDWHYDDAPLAAIEEPSLEASGEPKITAADVDQLLAPATEPAPSAEPQMVADGVESLSAVEPHDRDERVHAHDAREEQIEATAHSLGLISDEHAEPLAEPRVETAGDESHASPAETFAPFAHHHAGRRKQHRPWAAQNTASRDDSSWQYEVLEEPAPAEPVATLPDPVAALRNDASVVAAAESETGVASHTAAEEPETGVASHTAPAPRDDDQRAHFAEAREEDLELTAHDLGLIAAAASVSAATDTSAVAEIDGEPATAEDVAMVAEVDAAIAAAEAASTVPDPNAAPVAAAAASPESEDEPPSIITPAGFNPVPKVEIPNDYVPVAESVHALYQLSLNGWEGPLDLLLFLIKRHQVDIFDIPVSFICERYLDCIKVMEDLDIDVAAEFLFMASELLHLKSRMLLPKPEGETAEEDDIDPRAELVRRLLEYQKYKDAAERFGSLDRFNRDIFGREPEPQPVVTVGDAPLKEVGLFALVKAFEAVLKRQKPEVRHLVMMEQVSVRKRIRALLQLMESQEPLSFEMLLEGHTSKLDIVVTFLALLEMGKLKFLRIFQSEDGVIYVHPKFDDVSVAFQRLEGIDESQYAG